MTLEEGKRRVLMLLDEYSNGGELDIDEDIEAKLHDFFDIAQKDVAAYQPILRRVAVTLDGSGSVALPGDAARVLRVTKDGRRTARYEVVDGKLLSGEGDTSTLTLDYTATPETITPETEDSYVFEVSEAAANCLPFFVASQHLLADITVDYGAFYNMYLQMRGALDRSAGTLSGGSVRQTLYHTGRR